MIKNLRDEIDKIDDEILRLYLKRLALTDEIGKEKAENNSSIEVSKREDEILKRLLLGLSEKDKKSVENLYAEVFKESKRRQSEFLKPTLIKSALIGRDVEKSFSKKIHGLLGTDYTLLSLNEEEFLDFAKNPSFDYFNVTMPYKREIIPYLDELSLVAKKIGTVNTVVVKNGKKWGYNTDIDGLRYLFESENFSLFSKNVVILGTGATANTAKYYALSCGAKTVCFIGRTSYYNYDNYDKLADTEVLINTTPVGKNGYESLVDLTKFPNLCFVADVNYSPLKTKLLLDAEVLNVKCVGGLKMLIMQAIKAEEIWTGINYSEKADEIYKLLLKDMQNITLIGMPSAGKTTVGRILAEKLNRDFIDIDEEIEKATGFSPLEIINTHGEEYFRNIEEKTIEKFANTRGKIIATGGGTVLKKKNVSLLKQNSMLVYLQRDIKSLSAENRPLSQNNGIENLFLVRKPLYEKYADVTVKNDGDIEVVTKRIIDAYENFSY